MFIHRIDEDCSLKLFVKKDAEQLYKLTDRNREHLRRWLPWVDSSKTLKDTEGFIEYTLKQLAAGDGLQVGIWSGTELAGVIGFNRVDHANNQAWIGYWLGEEFQGRGLMTKACRSIVDYGFKELGFNRIAICCAVANDRSRKVAERVGATQEGILRQGERLPSGYHDIVLYSLLQEEWAKDQEVSHGH